MKSRQINKTNLSNSRVDIIKVTDEAHLREAPDADYVTTLLDKINVKQFNQLKLMIRPKAQLVENLNCLMILFNKESKDKLGWPIIQRFLQKNDLLALMSTFQAVEFKKEHVNKAAEILESILKDEQPLKKALNDIEQLQLHIKDATIALIRFAKFVQEIIDREENDIELPQNLSVTMEHFQKAPSQASTTDLQQTFNSVPLSLKKPQKPSPVKQQHMTPIKITNDIQYRRNLLSPEKGSRSVRSLSSQSQNHRGFITKNQVQAKPVHKVNQSCLDPRISQYPNEMQNHKPNQSMMESPSVSQYSLQKLENKQNIQNRVLPSPQKIEKILKLKTNSMVSKKLFPTTK